VNSPEASVGTKEGLHEIRALYVSIQMKKRGDVKLEGKDNERRGWKDYPRSTRGIKGGKKKVRSTEQVGKCFKGGGMKIDATPDRCNDRNGATHDQMIALSLRGT